jgi:hypothetical protein
MFPNMIHRYTFVAMCVFGFLGSNFLLAAVPQKCPTETSDVAASITGTLEYHPGAYAWYGVRTAQPVCGEKIIQIGFSNSAQFRESHQWTGCQVTVTGSLMVPVTGYWTASLGMTEAQVKPETSCKSNTPLPNYASEPVPASLKVYRVTAIYEPKTTIFTAEAREIPSGKLLTPWQRYASDSGNGARDILRMSCADGFVASNPTGGSKLLFPLTTDDDLNAIVLGLSDDSTKQQITYICTRQAKR